MLGPDSLSLNRWWLTSPLRPHQARKWIRLPARWLLRERRPGVTMLMYHRVGGGTPSEIDLPMSMFIRQLEYVRRRFRIVSLDTVERLIRTGSSVQTDLLVLTFDDGYEEMYSTVLPVLLRYRIPAILYLPTAYIGKRREIDWGHHQRMEARHRPDPMTWTQVRALLQSGLITIGAHTHTHADLSVAPLEKIRDEFECSNALFRQHLGIEVRHFAYPFSRTSPAAQALVPNYYHTAVVGGSVKNPFPELNLYALQRVPVSQSDGFWLFRLRLATLRRRKRPGLAQTAVQVDETGS